MIIKMNRKQFRYLFGKGRYLREIGIKFLKVDRGKDKGVPIIPFLFSSPDKV